MEYKEKLHKRAEKIEIPWEINPNKEIYNST